MCELCMCNPCECKKRSKAQRDALSGKSQTLGSIPMSRIDKIGADRLAYECARQVIANNIDSRSGIGDALLDYLRVGGPGYPDSVPGWMEEYEKAYELNVTGELPPENGE